VPSDQAIPLPPEAHPFVPIRHEDEHRISPQRHPPSTGEGSQIQETDPPDVVCDEVLPVRRPQDKPLASCECARNQCVLGNAGEPEFSLIGWSHSHHVGSKLHSPLKIDPPRKKLRHERQKGADPPLAIDPSVSFLLAGQKKPDGLLSMRLETTQELIKARQLSTKPIGINVASGTHTFRLGSPRTRNPRLATHSELLRAGFTGKAEKPAKREAGRKCCQGPALRFNLLPGILICESRPG